MLMDDLIAASRAKEVELDPFFYTAFFPIANFVPAAILPINVPINADADFVIRYANFVAYTAAPAPVINPNYFTTIFDSSSGRQLMDQPVPVQLIFGTGQLPFIWPEPKLIKAGGTMIITMVNGEAAAANVYVTLCGFKVFKMSGYQR